MTKINLDILAFGAHPDDVEISCGATIIQSTQQNRKVGIIDLTAGEMGSRGSKELRLEEATKAGEILGLSIRENLGFRDCHFSNDEWHRMKIIEKIRQYRPRVVHFRGRRETMGGFLAGPHGCLCTCAGPHLQARHGQGWQGCTE